MLIFCCFTYLAFNNKGENGIRNLATLEILSICPMYIKKNSSEITLSLLFSALQLSDQLTSTALKQPFPVHKQTEIPRGGDLVSYMGHIMYPLRLWIM